MDDWFRSASQHSLHLPRAGEGSVQSKALAWGGAWVGGFAGCGGRVKMHSWESGQPGERASGEGAARRAGSWRAGGPESRRQGEWAAGGRAGPDTAPALTQHKGLFFSKDE